MIPRTRVMLWLCGIALAAAPTWGQAPPSPATCIYDRCESSHTDMSPKEIEEKRTWEAVAEDTLDHTFKGDAILMNDRLAIELSRSRIGVSVYSRSAAGFKPRVSLASAKWIHERPSAVKIIENSAAAVCVEATFKSGDGASSVRMRLTAGDMMLEVRGVGTDGALRVFDCAQYVVVPDFFADDLVFETAAIKTYRVALPTENSLLGLADDGAAIVACVWSSAAQKSRILTSTRDGATSRSCEIDLPKGKSIWVAALDGPGIWHAQRGAGKAIEAELARTWKKPFPARWRVNFVGDGPQSDSGVLVDPADRSEIRAACWFDGGSLVRSAGAPTARDSSRLAIVYPIDRSQATPLNAFCFVDVLRNSLGMGPCQYVLDAEGLAQKENPTPEQVSRWVEKELEKKKSRRDADALRERLNQMAQQVQRTEDRLEQYRASAAEIARLATDPQQGAAAAARSVAAIATTLQPAATTRPATPLPQAVKETCERIGGLLDNDDALATARPLLAAICAAGADQNYRLAKSRMAFRRIIQECAVIEENAAAAAIGARIRQQAEKTLGSK